MMSRASWLLWCVSIIVFVVVVSGNRRRHRHSSGAMTTTAADGVAGVRRREVEIYETERTLVPYLGHDLTRRFSFGIPRPPEFLDINPVTGSVQVRDGHRLDYETNPTFNFTVVATKLGYGSPASEYDRMKHS